MDHRFIRNGFSFRNSSSLLVGTSILQDISSIIKYTIRRAAIFARWGEEEFDEWDSYKNEVSVIR